MQDAWVWDMYRPARFCEERGSSRSRTSTSRNLRRATSKSRTPNKNRPREATSAPYASGANPLPLRESEAVVWSRRREGPDRAPGRANLSRRREFKQSPSADISGAVSTTACSCQRSAQSIAGPGSGRSPPAFWVPRRWCAMKAKDLLGPAGRGTGRDLSGRGLQILARNWRCKDGEIDIVALDQRGWCLRGEDQIRHSGSGPARVGHQAESLAASAAWPSSGSPPGPGPRTGQDRRCRRATDRAWAVQHRAHPRRRLVQGHVIAIEADIEKRAGPPWPWSPAGHSLHEERTAGRRRCRRSRR